MSSSATARAPSAHGLKFRDVLNALRQRGRDDDADRYERAFMSRLCPPITRDHVLDLPFDDLCAATRLLTQASFSSPFDGQTREGSDFRYGVWYLEQMGMWPPRDT